MQNVPQIANEVMDSERVETQQVKLEAVKPDEVPSGLLPASSPPHPDEAAVGDDKRFGRTMANGKMNPYDRKWLRNFRRLRAIIMPDGSLEYSSLSIDDERRMKNFVKQQRNYFRMRERDEETPLTDERYGLLAGANFSFVPVRGTGRARSHGRKGNVDPEAAARRMAVADRLAAEEKAEDDRLAAEEVASDDDVGDPVGRGPDGERKMHGLDRMWHEKFERLKPIIRPDGSPDYSALDAEAQMPMQRFVYGQRKAFRRRENGEKSTLTDERYGLLIEAGFSFVPVDRIWKEKLERLRPIIRPDGRLDYSAIDREDRKRMQRFVGSLRKSFRQRENDGKSTLTDERYRLLSEAGFGFVRVKAGSGHRPNGSSLIKTEAAAELGGKTSKPKVTKRSKKRKASVPEPSAVKTERYAGDASESFPGNGLRRVKIEPLSPADDAKMSNDATHADESTMAGCPGDKKMGAYDRKWHESFDRLRAIITPDGGLDYSALDERDRKRLKSFVKDQRKYFRRRENDEKSPMTDERYNLLAGANFRFDARGGARPRPSGPKAGAESGPEDNMHAILEGADERFPLFDEGAEGEERAPCGPERDGGGSESATGTLREERKSCEPEPNGEGPAEEAGGASESADGRATRRVKRESCKPEPDDKSSAEVAGDASESMLGTECTERKAGEPKSTSANDAGERSESLLRNNSNLVRVENGSQNLADVGDQDDRCCLM